MHFLDAKNIDRARWEQLVNSKGEHFFSSLNYLDAVAENWGAYIIDDYRAAIVVPFKQKVGQRWVYQPLFFRASEWLGDWRENEKNQLLSQLKTDFNSGRFLYHDNEGGELCYQVIEPTSDFRLHYNKLAKRMLKKGINSELVLTNELHDMDFLSLLVSELKEKADTWGNNGQKVFMALLNNYRSNGNLRFYGVVLHGKLVGGVVTLWRDKRVLYLKGSANIEAKKMGAMYLAMDKAIEEALSSNHVFDFGGSRIDGVKRFNENLGGTSVFYQSTSWDSSPLLLKMIKKVKEKWKKIKR